MVNAVHTIPLRPYPHRITIARYLFLLAFRLPRILFFLALCTFFLFAGFIDYRRRSSPVRQRFVCQLKNLHSFPQWLVRRVLYIRSNIDVSRVQFSRDTGNVISDGCLRKIVFESAATEILSGKCYRNARCSICLIVFNNIDAKGRSKPHISFFFFFFLFVFIYALAHRIPPAYLYEDWREKHDKSHFLFFTGKQFLNLVRCCTYYQSFLSVWFWNWAHVVPFCL